MDKIKNDHISIIIPNWNGMKYIGACLNSVYESDFMDIEVIVVDNGSSDDSVDIIENNYPDVKLIRFKRNKGFAVACNEGIRNSSGEFVFLLNNDVELEPDCLTVLRDVLLANPDCSMAGGKILRYDRRDYIDAAGDALTVGGAPYNRGHDTKDTGQFDKEEYVFGVCAGAAMYRRSLFDEIGMFDEDFFAYIEDVDLNLRALLTGHKARYTPYARCYHHGNASLGSLSSRHVYLTNRNKLFLMIKNFPLNWFLRYAFHIASHQVKMAVLFSTTERGWSFFRSRLTALIKIPKMVIKRHKFFFGCRPDWTVVYPYLDKSDNR